MPVAIITGGAAGIGRHLCAGFAREGYVVASLDIRPMDSPHPDIHFFPCDLRDEAAITTVFRTVSQTLGTPRVLINNGAISRFQKPFPLLEAKEFWARTCAAPSSAAGSSSAFAGEQATDASSTSPPRATSRTNAAGKPTAPPRADWSP